MDAGKLGGNNFHQICFLIHDIILVESDVE